jgi:antirestriction protein
MTHTYYPRIYVACLAAYNDGRLHGVWIDADLDPTDIWKEVKEMLAKSPVVGAEEWAIHDYENFAGITISEGESFESVHRHARMLDKFGEAWAIFVEHICTTERR